MESLIRTEIRSWLFGTLVVCAALLCSSPSAAQVTPAHASLILTRGEGAGDCPDAAALAEQVQRIAGVSVLTTTPPSVTPTATWIQVAIIRDFSGYRAEINARGEHRGSRSLEDLGPTCASLSDAIAITIAIFLDPYASSPRPRPIPLPAPERQMSLHRPEPPPYDSRRLPPLTLELAGGAAFGMLEHAQPLLAAAIGWRATDRWSVALTGAFVFPDSAPQGNGSVDLSLSYGTLIGCARALGEARGTRVNWCAAVLLGSLRGSGRDYTETSSQSLVWVGVAAGPELLIPFAPSLAWSLTGLGVLPIFRQGFDIESQRGRQKAFVSSAVASEITLGIRGEL